MAHGGLLTAVALGGAAIVFFVYAETGSRLVEAAVSVLLVAPAAFVVIRARYAHKSPPLSQEAPSLRTSAILNAISSVIFVVNVPLLLRAPHVGWMALRDAAIAEYFIVIPIVVIAGYFIRQRFARARATGASVA